MEKNLNYGVLIESALRGVVRQILRGVQENNGLPGDHHFYITFQTPYPGVQVPDHLAAQYPDEMTIVIQHKFWDLDVSETQFSIGLSFHRIPEHMTIPFAAISDFTDPSSDFRLQFEVIHEEESEKSEENTSTLAEQDKSNISSAQTDATDQPNASENVIILDQFRNK